MVGTGDHSWANAVPHTVSGGSRLCTKGMSGVCRSWMCMRRGETLAGMSAATTITPGATRQPPPRRIRRGWGAAIALIVAMVVLLVVVVPFAAAYHVWATAAVHSTTPTDAIVVLGAAQYDGKPSPVLENRLEHAQSLLAAGVAPRIITVGGKQPGDTFTEGEAGAMFLSTAGVPSDQLVPVGSGTDTLTSLQAVAQTMHNNGWTSATIVTDPAHVARSEAIATTLGIAATGNPTSTGDGSQVTSEYVARETAGYLYHSLLARWQVKQEITQ